MIWFQGCTLACRNCFNPQTHSHKPNRLVPVETVIDEIMADQAKVDGVTISGGEPLQQPAALLRLLTGIRREGSLSTILFSGYTLEEMEPMRHGREILKNIDVLIAGRYVSVLRTPYGLRGSSNQRIHLMTERYCMADIEKTPVAEISIDAHGRVSVSGIDPPDLKGADRQRSGKSLSDAYRPHVIGAHPPTSRSEQTNRHTVDDTPPRTRT